jgi:hypothetical protein
MFISAVKLLGKGVNKTNKVLLGKKKTTTSNKYVLVTMDVFFYIIS